VALDNDKLNAFMGSFVQDLGPNHAQQPSSSATNLACTKRCDRLTAEALAEKTGTDPRYVREWLSAQAASKYVQYDPAKQQFSLSEEQACARGRRQPAFIPGAFRSPAQFKAIPKMIEASEAARAWAGTNTMRRYFTAPSASSVQL
jgi:hypothetical protein